MLKNFTIKKFWKINSDIRIPWLRNIIFEILFLFKLRKKYKAQKWHMRKLPIPTTSEWTQTSIKWEIFSVVADRFGTILHAEDSIDQVNRLFLIPVAVFPQQLYFNTLTFDSKTHQQWISFVGFHSIWKLLIQWCQWRKECKRFPIQGFWLF